MRPLWGKNSWGERREREETCFVVLSRAHPGGEEEVSVLTGGGDRAGVHEGHRVLESLGTAASPLIKC